MEIKKYRSFIRATKRDVNKLTVGYSYDKKFENKVNLYLTDSITQNEFDNYLDNELYLNINESYLITESLASKFADKVSSKVKSIFNNLYSKLKETKGFEMIISFFNKVVSGFSKFWKLLKNIKSGKILKKLLITLGITSLASYILTQFGAGWVALMGGRMTANLIGKKVSDKVVKEGLNNLMIYEEFILNKDYKTINIENLDKINNFYNKNYQIIDSYYQYVFENIGNASLYNEFKTRFKMLKNSINKKYKTSSFVEFINWFLNNKDIKRTHIIKSIEFASEKWKKSNQNQISIVDQFESIIGFKLGSSENTNKDLGKDLEVKKSESDNKSQVKGEEKSNIESKKDSEDNKGKEGGDKKNQEVKKTSIWSKIGSGISKFFKILKKLKWAIVIFFGVVFILNLIFSPIFEPILAIANVSSFGMILSDGFEETANAVGSIPKINASDIKLDLDITDDLPSDSEVTKNLQNVINDVKDNISDNSEAATEDVTDLVNNMKSDVLYDTEENLEGTEEVVKETGDKLTEFWNTLEKSVQSKISGMQDKIGVQPGGSSFTVDYSLTKSLESGKLSIEDLDKIEKLNTDDFYTSVSKIQQNAKVALQNKLSQAGVTNIDYDLIVYKKLDNGNYRAYYLIPKK